MMFTIRGIPTGLQDGDRVVISTRSETVTFAREGVPIELNGMREYHLAGLTEPSTFGLAQLIAALVDLPSLRHIRESEDFVVYSLHSAEE